MWKWYEIPIHVSINKMLLFSHVHSCTCCRQLPLRSCAELSQSQLKLCGPDPKMCTACPFADEAGCLEPGPGFSACNICAMPWVSLLHSSGSWLAALCHSACPPRVPHVRCEEGRSWETINFRFPCDGSKVCFLHHVHSSELLTKDLHLNIPGSNTLLSVTAGNPLRHWGTRHPQVSPPWLGHFLRPQAEEARWVLGAA